MEDLQVSVGLSVPAAELSVQQSRSGGPGGQNVNKVSSQIQLRWNVRGSSALPSAVKRRFLAKYSSRLTKEGELILVGRSHRDAPRNLADVRERLAEMIRQVEKPPTKRRPTRPTRGSQERRIKSKRQRSEKKERRRWNP